MLPLSPPVQVLHFEQKAYMLSDFSETQLQTRSNAMTGAVKEFEQKHDQVVSHLDKLRDKVNRGHGDHGAARSARAQNYDSLYSGSRYSRCSILAVITCNFHLWMCYFRLYH